MKLTREQRSYVGWLGEEVHRRQALAGGFRVNPLHEMAARDGHGPWLQRGESEGTTSPDYELIRHGYSFCSEVKTKLALTYWRIGGELQHGINQTAYDPMREYERETGKAVFITVVELFHLWGIDEAKLEPRTQILPWVSPGWKAWCSEDKAALDDVVSKLLLDATVLTRRVSSLGVRQALDRGVSMVYFDRSQLAADPLGAFERHVLSLDRLRARRERRREDEAI